MKTNLLLLISAAIAALFATVAPLRAAEAVTQPVEVVAPAAIETGAPSAAPDWAITALSWLATASLAYQALLAFAHKRAAETASTQDDEWLAQIEGRTWFKVLDRMFNWGAYLGSRWGGRRY